MNENLAAASHAEKIKLGIEKACCVLSQALFQLRLGLFDFQVRRFGIVKFEGSHNIANPGFLCCT